MAGLASYAASFDQSLKQTFPLMFRTRRVIPMQSENEHDAGRAAAAPGYWVLMIVGICGLMFFGTQLVTSNPTRWEWLWGSAFSVGLLLTAEVRRRK